MLELLASLFDKSSLNLLEKLVDRVVQLSKYREERDAKYYRTFIEPLHFCFEDLHKDYILKFESYKSDLDGSPQSLRKVIRKVRFDRVFSDHARAKVIGLASIAGKDHLTTYIQLIESYLSAPIGAGDYNSFQKWRGELLERLKKCDRPPQIAAEIQDDAVRQWQAMTECEKAEEEILELVGQMQDLYGRIVKEHAKLRDRYLNY